MLNNLCIILTKKLIPQRKNFLFFVLIVCILLLTCGSKSNNDVSAASMNSSSGSNVGESRLSVSQADVSSIDAIVNAIYESITFREGEEPNLERLRSLFTPKAQFIRITPDGIIKMDLESFISSFSERVKTGAMKSFYEAEISRKTNAFGSIAQVFSSYSKGINTKDPKSMVRGINSIQLFHDGQRWWMSSILWQDE
jgi:hypothetical protein